MEVICHISRGEPIVATVEHKDAMAAVDLAHDKLERLLTRKQDKTRSRRRGPGRSAAGAGAAPVAAGEEE